MDKTPWGYLVAVFLVLCLCTTAVVAEYTNVIPCSWYSHSSFKDVPARCLTVYHK